jgi:hypothetical protein
MDNSREPFCLSSIDIKELSTRLQVTESIITCNADRLRVICDRLLALHEYFRRVILARRDVALKEPTLNSKQMSLVLEFFLQIDGKYPSFIVIIDFFIFLVDVFYMKTCRFRNAEPCSSIKGLFCNDESPKARYSMVPCGGAHCPCCHSMENNNENSSSSSTSSIIDFENSSSHRFINGYTTYLNCPAVC